MKKFKDLSVLLIALMLGACGGSDGPCLGSDCGSGSDGTTEVGGIQLLASSPQLPSDQSGNQSVALTAVVTDTNGNALKDVTVQYSLPSGNGLLGVTQPVTDASGISEASISSFGNAQNRTITVRAQAGTKSSTVDILVSGTALTITGPAALAAGDSAQYSILLTDSEGAGVSGQAFSVQSANGNTITSSVSSTGSNGSADITVTATVGGTDTLTVSALGLTATRQVTVSNDQFRFVSPASAYEAELGENVPVQLEWISGGSPVVGQTVQFSSTRGTLSSANANSNGSGIATVTISSNNSGPAVITARDPVSGTSTSVNMEFVAINPVSVELQASPFTVVVNSQSSITATVRDANDNLVKNQTVYFGISDVTGGSLTAATAETDSVGQARIFYNAGSSSSATNAVVITGTIRNSNNTDIDSDAVQLTVAGVERDITIGTGNTLFEIGTALYAKEWVILVKDGVGNAVPNSNVQVSLRSTQYRKGYLVLPPEDSELSGWQQLVTTLPGESACLDEDTNRNGILDIGLGEDYNGSGQIEAGGDALVAAVDADASAGSPCSLNSTGAQGSNANVTTNSQGIARVCTYYPQSYAMWLEVEIGAQASVSGTEFSAQQDYWLEVLADDVDNENESPPNLISPYGIGSSCADPD
jgi:hypothetical protein